MIEPDVHVVQFAGVSVEVRELTVGEIRGWMREQPSTDPVDVLLFEGFRLRDLRRCTDLSDEDEAMMTPSELRRLWVVVREVNADFFGLQARIGALADSLTAAPSTAGSPASSPPGTSGPNPIRGLFSWLRSRP